MSFISILKYASVWSIILPFIAGIILFKRINTDSKIILLITIGGVIPQILGNIHVLTGAFINITYNLYTPFEFACYAMLFRKKYTFPKLKLIFKLTLLFFSLISLLLLFYNNISTLFLNQWVMVNNIIQLIWVGMYLIQVYLNDELEFNTDQPFFWFLIAITCYASCTTVFYSLWYILLSNAFTKYRFVEIIHHFFNISLYLLFFVGILKNKKVSMQDGNLSK